MEYNRTDTATVYYNNIEIGQLQDITWTKHRDMAPIYTMGDKVSEVPKSIDGSLIFKWFDTHAIYDNMGGPDAELKDLTIKLISSQGNLKFQLIITAARLIDKEGILKRIDLVKGEQITFIADCAPPNWVEE